MAFEWDPNKALANVRKHGVQFTESCGVFDDEFAITVREDDEATAEERFVTLGMGARGRVLIVVYCYRGNDIRIISARPATLPERGHYERQR